MDNNKKLEIAKRFLLEYQQKVGWWKKSLEEVGKDYIGNALQQRTEMMQRWIDDDSIFVEALEKFIKDTEDFDKFDADQSKAEALAQEGIETTESKIQAEENLIDKGQFSDKTFNED